MLASVGLRAVHTARSMSTKVAVVLSGCGVYDGTEVHESSAVLMYLSRHAAQVSMFAPDKVCSCIWFTFKQVFSGL